MVQLTKAFVPSFSFRPPVRPPQPNACVRAQVKEFMKDLRHQAELDTEVQQWREKEQRKRVWLH